MKQDNHLSLTPKIVIFDLWNTLIEATDKDYDRALRWLATDCFNRQYADLKILSEQCKANYLESRKLSHKETSFISQLQYFESKLNVKLSRNYLDIESEFLRKFCNVLVVKGAQDLLQELNKHKVKCYILSNSIFSGITLKKCLDNLGIGSSFEKVFSSSDLGFRKPYTETFDSLVFKLNISTNEYLRVFFIGDSFDKDYVPAERFGFYPMILGKNKEHSCRQFSSLGKILDHLKKSYLN